LQYKFVSLLLSVGFFFYEFIGVNYDNFGIHFRYLTIWGLTEALTCPTNNTPLGSVTSGLPYPFLNNMLFAERVSFYVTTTLIGIGFYFTGWFLMRAKLRFLG